MSSAYNVVEFNGRTVFMLFYSVKVQVYADKIREHENILIWMSHLEVVSWRI